MGLEVNRKEVARLLGVSMPTVSDWVDRGLPVVNRGSRGIPWSFDVAACFRWRLEYELANAVGASTHDVSREDAERRKIIADAILAEIRVAEQLRSVVRVEDVSRIWEGRIVASRETFQGIAQRLAPLLVGEADQGVIESQIEREINRALEDLAAWEPADAPDDDGDDEGDEEPDE